jgi:hypothetical protein
MDPVKARKKPIVGKPKRRRVRRPKLSIVFIAGIAPNQLIIPNPQLAKRALNWEKPLSTKILDE